MATKETFIDAIAHELPVNVIEQTFPGFIKPRENLRTSQFIISDISSPPGKFTVPIAEGAYVVSRELTQKEEHYDIPSGVVWNLSGEESGSILFNLDEFDKSTVAGWVAEWQRILAGAVREPDQDWRLLGNSSGS